MNVLRNVEGFELNQGTGMANGLFNISHTEKPNYLSSWFDRDTKKELLECTDAEFVTLCNDLVKN